MGLIKQKKTQEQSAVDIKSGSFTVDSKGKILSSTLPSSISENFLLSIAQNVLETFNNSRSVGLFADELVINFPTVKITARNMRGGAFINIAPVNYKS